MTKTEVRKSLLSSARRARSLRGGSTREKCIEWIMAHVREAYDAGILGIELGGIWAAAGRR